MQNNGVPAVAMVDFRVIPRFYAKNKVLIHHAICAVFMFGYPIIMAVLTTLNKKALDEGMDINIYCFYRNGIAVCCLIAPALYFERGAWKSMTWQIFLELLLLSLLEHVGNQHLLLDSLAKLEPYQATGIALTLPAFTWLMLAAFRIEHFQLDTLYGLWRIIGSGLVLLGVICLISLSIPKIKLTLLKGLLLGLAGVLFSSFYGILLPITSQRITSPSMKTPLSISLCTCTLGMLINGLIALQCGHETLAAWTIAKHLFCYLLSGIVVSGFYTYVVIQATRLWGTVIVSAIIPFSLPAGNVIYTINNNKGRADDPFVAAARVTGVVVEVVGLLLILGTKIVEQYRAFRATAVNEEVPAGAVDEEAQPSLAINEGGAAVAALNIEGPIGAL